MHSLLTNKKQFTHLFLMTLIVLIAIFFRMWHIELAPPGLYPDEANNATNAYTAMTSGNYQWFYPDNNGREGAYINLMAIGFKIFGVHTLTIKLPSILFGVLTVLSLYFLARELFPSRQRIALIAPYMCAVSFWAVNFSRIGFRAIMMLPILCFTFYFLFRGIRTGRYRNYIYAGLICGLGFHTYIAFRIMPLLLIVLLILFLVVESDFIKKYYKAILVFFASAAVTVLPMLLTFHTHPEYLSARTGDVSIFSSNNRVDNLPLELVKNVGLSLAKFNLYGDPNWRHGFPPFPMLEPLTGLAFLSGLLFMIGTFFNTLYLRIKKGVRNRNLVISGLLLAWFIGFLAPEFLTTEGLPHALRALGVMPVVFLFAAYAIDVLIEKREKKIAHDKHKMHSILPFVQKGALTIFFAYITVFGFMKYHVYWANRDETAEAFNYELRHIAYTLQKSDEPAQIIMGPLKRLPIEIYNTKSTKITYFYPDQIDNVRIENGPIYMTHRNTDVLENLANRYNEKMIITDVVLTNGTSYVKITLK